ncbi:probable protein phosphatase 2C 33 isoform X2 [Humulus lupulus]|nr:probable protein phosphatase 2C 33 isoform X2 [Humulus lupulus]XP_062108051.1 probable protein phosphatase 2C 33 isoform X2 [Humulus lupulus]
MGSCLSVEGASAGAGGLLPYGSASSSPPGRRKDRRKIRRTNSSSSSSPSSPSFTMDSHIEKRLHRVSGRICLNGCSDMTSLFTKQGKKGINQDAMIVWENFGSRADTIFCGVFDGHGPYGHLVAKKVRDSLPLKLSSHWDLITADSKNGILGGCNGALGGTPETGECAYALEHVHGNEQTELISTLKDSFLKAFKFMDKELKLHPHIDCYCSGTTAVTLVKQGQDLFIGNIGDSRAVLGTRDEDNSLVAVQLTVDLKPSLPREAERIKRFKGRVFALKNEPDVDRVWLPNSNSPGLAMARAFGDFCLKDFGLISVPDISYHRLSEKDEFVILATDGIWDVFSNEEVVSIVASSPQSTAAKVVVETAVRTWRLKFPYSKVDDCAVVCLFLNSDSNKSSVISTANDKTVPGNNDGSSLVGLDSEFTCWKAP